LDEDFFLPMVLPFNDGRDNGEVDVETTTEAFKPSKDIRVGCACELVGFSPYLVKVWLMALGY
jgi:hypothetical protein